jgi:hypothetical protein
VSFGNNRASFGFGCRNHRVNLESGFVCRLLVDRASRSFESFGLEPGGVCAGDGKAQLAVCVIEVALRCRDGLLVLAQVGLLCFCSASG